MTTVANDPVIQEARRELEEAGITAGLIHDLRDAYVERADLLAVAPDLGTLRAYLNDKSMPSTSSVWPG